MEVRNLVGAGKYTEQRTGKNDTEAPSNAAEQNVAAVKAFYAAMGAGKPEHATEILDASAITLYEAESLPVGGEWRGLDGLQRLTARHAAMWTDVAFEFLQIAAAGDLVFVYGRLSQRARKTGSKIEMLMIEVWRFLDGKAIEIRPIHWDTMAMVRALGEG